MRSIVEFDETRTPAVQRLYIHHAPHRRMHTAVLARYRQDLWEAWKALGRSDTIAVPIELVVTFINPSSPDLDNLVTALFQALDGVTGKKPTILRNDSQISHVSAGLMFPK